MRNLIISVVLMSGAFYMPVSVAQNNNPFYQTMRVLNGKNMPKPEITDNMPSALSKLLAKAVEDTTKRTAYSSTYITPGGQYVALYSKQMVNYYNSAGNLVPVKIDMVSCTKGWVAAQQPHPCYFHLDRSTGISLDDKSEFIFNKNVEINGVEYPQQLKAVNKDEVKLDLGTDIHKKVRYLSNTIETDYIIDKPLGTSLDISENVEFPEGYRLEPDKSTGGRQVKSLWQGDYMLVSPDGEKMSELGVPLCYDATGENWCIGYYRDEVKDGKHILHTIVPDAWLNKVKYPITIDPVIVGPRTWWPQNRNIASNSWPNFNTDSILVTIPGGITITHLYISYSFETNVNHYVPFKYGRIYFKTPCAKTPLLSCDTTNLPGYCYVDTTGNRNDFGPSPFFPSSALTCCFNPQCTAQYFYFVVGLSRDCPPSAPCLPNGLDSTNFIWTITYPTVPFWAYIVGNTDEANWNVTPKTVCSNVCTVNLNINAQYGVPPYTVTHPWASGKTVFGTATTCNSSTGTANIPLTIPGCPTFCGSVTQLTVPPPIVYDVCGDTVKGLTSQTITINPVPKITVDSIKICSGDQINIDLQSCVPGSTFSWKGSDKTSGSTSNINYPGIDTSLTSSTSVTYTATCTFNGCSDTGHPYVVITPGFTPTITPASKDTTITAGNSVQLTADGGAGATYLWIPSSGLSCTTCANPTATPTVTTKYYVAITPPGKCTKIDSVLITVNEDCGEVVWVPSAFSPNGDGKNDVLYVRGGCIQNMTFLVFDRWGNKVFESTQQSAGWDGRYLGVPLNTGTYVYSLIAHTMDKNNNLQTISLKGNITLVR